MIVCAQCSTSNSIDSTFCRKCGAGIPEEQLAEAREQLDVLIAEGNHAFNENRTEDALAVAESVLVTDPESTSALWLKAICHERHGDIALALECADRIVDLNPDSELDKIRRGQLRTKLSNSVLLHEPPNRRLAAVAAVSISLLVVCVGFLAAYLVQARNQPDVVVNNVPAPSRELTQEQLQQQLQPTGNPTSAPVNANPGTVNQPVGADDVPPIQQTRPTPPPTSSPERPTGEIQLPTAVPNGSQLPTPTSGNAGLGEPIDVRPINVPPRPKPDEDPDGTFPVGGTAPKKPEPGQIEISVYNGEGKPAPNNGGSGSASSNGIEALNRTATQAFQVGNYAQAANLFEQALRQGGDPVRLNQRLGQSYERLGRSGEAIEAYRRAVQAGEAAIAQGKANPSGIRAAIESSQQALKKLGG